MRKVGCVAFRHRKELESVKKGRVEHRQIVPLHPFHQRKNWGQTGIVDGNQSCETLSGSFGEISNGKPVSVFS
jgi:hypothetical protein